VHSLLDKVSTDDLHRDMNSAPQSLEIADSRQLLKSTVLAICVAALLLFTVILPAERAIDPTGVGRLLGLTQMGEIKQRQLKQAMAEMSDILSQADNAKALISIQQRLDAIEAKLQDIKSQGDAKQGN
jgi:hypothetical protein